MFRKKDDLEEYYKERKKEKKNNKYEKIGFIFLTKVTILHFFA